MGVSIYRRVDQALLYCFRWQLYFLVLPNVSNTPESSLVWYEKTRLTINATLHSTWRMHNIWLTFQHNENNHGHASGSRTNMRTKTVHQFGLSSRCRHDYDVFLYQYKHHPNLYNLIYFLWAIISFPLSQCFLIKLGCWYGFQWVLGKRFLSSVMYNVGRVRLHIWCHSKKTDWVNTQPVFYHLSWLGLLTWHLWYLIYGEWIKVNDQVAFLFIYFGAL